MKQPNNPLEYRFSGISTLGLVFGLVLCLLFPCNPLTHAANAPLAVTKSGNTADSSLQGVVPSPRLASGPFEPSWESLQKNYQVPEWFRDAKFGIWAHWSAQCVPEAGDWYARNMYIQGHRQYAHHVAKYGHPSETGFMEIENLWKAEKWNPEKLMDLYVRAGAKYFVALANHHDNFDAYDSTHHAWNSVNVGPKRDIVGEWAEAARARGLYFGVSNHSAHAWHWFQTAYAYDAEGPKAGARYDAFDLRKEDGKGKWWDGLDPQELYAGANMAMPDGIKTIADRNAWHEANDRKWDENPPAMNPRFTATWYLRCKELVDKYRPDLVYFDNAGLPLGQTGLDIAAHYYNAGIAWHSGSIETVLNVKGSAQHPGALVYDIERGVAEGLLTEPWQTDTCIGAWHYDRDVYLQNKYKTSAQVIRMLADIVSKNGNLLLSVPMRGDGTIDDKEVTFLEEMGRWMSANGESIYGTRPWVVYGEGPSVTEAGETGHFGGLRDVRSKPYTAADIRFTTKGDHLYAIIMEQPVSDDRTVLITSLAIGSPHVQDFIITTIELLGHPGTLGWSRDGTGLRVQLPEVNSAEHVLSLKITRARAPAPDSLVPGRGISGPGATHSGRWEKMNQRVTGSAVKDGLIPDIRPLIPNMQIRDTVVIVGGDGNYYLTGSSGDDIWDHNDGVELWRSPNLKDWEYVGIVWTFEQDATWQKEWRWHHKPVRALWAPELHYIKRLKNYFITLSMPPGGRGILKSTTGKPEGPYVNALANDAILPGDIDASLFEDDDGAVYLVYGGGWIARMKDDLSALAEEPRKPALVHPDMNPKHHAASCPPRRDCADIGHEGAFLFKKDGKYYLTAADSFEGRYSSMVAFSDNLYGPYEHRHEAVPTGGGTNYFRDKQGHWWCAYFGNDDQAPFREKPAIVRVEFAPDGKIHVAKNQPDFVLNSPSSANP